eukprot:gene1916-1056_t
MKMGKFKDSDEEDEQFSFFQKLRLLPRKTLMASFSFFFVGLIILVFGIYAFKNFDDTNRSLSFVFVGVVLFLPGSYSAFIIMNVLFEVEGYSMEDIASYDEE